MRSINKERIRIERQRLRRAIDELGANLESNNYNNCATFIPPCILFFPRSHNA
jgi:hypothetical protein